jgi:hypothetical protein
MRLRGAGSNTGLMVLSVIVIVVAALLIYLFLIAPR